MCVQFSFQAFSTVSRCLLDEPRPVTHSTKRDCCEDQMKGKRKMEPDLVDFSHLAGCLQWVSPGLRMEQGKGLCHLNLSPFSRTTTPAASELCPPLLLDLSQEPAFKGPNWPTPTVGISSLSLRKSGDMLLLSALGGCWMTLSHNYSPSYHTGYARSVTGVDSQYSVPPAFPWPSLALMQALPLPPAP